MATVSMTTVTVVDATQPLALQELAHACGADAAWVVQLVEIGIVEAAPADAPPERWRFESPALQSALEARRLERDFGVGLDAAALILDLRHEVRRLKSRLAVHGL
jgi:chaperone modulatory protein CbpM